MQRLCVSPYSLHRNYKILKSPAFWPILCILAYLDTVCVASQRHETISKSCRLCDTVFIKNDQRFFKVTASELSTIGLAELKGFLSAAEDGKMV